MKVSDIAARVKRQFGDESGVQITDDDIMRWINDAQRELAVINDLLQTTATAAITVGQEQYYLPPDILKLRSVRVGGRRLAYVSIEDAADLIPDSRQGPTGTPTHFTQFANKIDLYPTPDRADGNDLQLYYTRIPLSVAKVTDTPELPSQYHNRITDFCLQHAYEMDENWQGASVKQAAFEAGRLELKGQEMMQESYPSIRSVEDW